MCICLLVGLPVCLLQAVCVLQVKNWLVSHATSGSHLFCHPPSHCPNGALQAMRLALSLKSHMVTPISFEIIAVFQATWSLLSNYLRSFPGRMQDICKSVPPWSLVKDDRAASYKKDCLACGCCHSNWATCLCLSFIGERNNGRTFYLQLLLFFSHFLVPPPQTTTRWAVFREALADLPRMRGGEERREEQPVTYCSRNPGAL